MNVTEQVLANQSLQVRRYTFKLYPNKAQDAVMTRQAALLAQLWNAALEQRERAYGTYLDESERKLVFSHPWPFTQRRDGKTVPVIATRESASLSYNDQSKDLTKIRADDPEYAAMSSGSQERCLYALDLAFKAFFKRAKGGAGKSSGYPRYKSPYAIEHKRADCTIWYRSRATNQKPLAGNGWNFVPSGSRWSLYAKGVPGRIKAKGRFPANPVDYKTCEIMRRGGVWWFSIVTVMERRRDPGAYKMRVEFNLIDEFVSVKTDTNGGCHSGWEEDFPSSDEQNGPEKYEVNEASAADSLEMGSGGRKRCDAPKLASAADSLEAGSGGRTIDSTIRNLLAADSLETDAIQSDRDKRRKKFSYRWRQETRRIAKRKAREARIRNEALHLWTARLIASASELEVVCPPIKESTKSAKGNERNHGAAVKTVAMLNRHILAQAPAMAIQMLEYKAAEAGLPPIVRINPEEHAIAIGAKLPAAIKSVRRMKREIKDMKHASNG